MKRLHYLFLGLLLFISYTFSIAQTPQNISFTPEIFPVQNASFVLQWDDVVVVNDPVGNIENFTKNGNPHLILVSDIHRDHFSVETLLQFQGNFTIVTCQAVFEKLPEALQKKSFVLANGEKTSLHSIEIEAIPMYNLAVEKQNFHPKGRGNAFVLTKNETRIYISGDTEDIPEMRNLKNIDVAFICMNLPYTMHYTKAADAVLEFKPKTVIPYHYRGNVDGETVFSDVTDFKNIINRNNASIRVELLEWY
jgi:L-ascorbate metabolism protein UlaG (beta-lactamase superfamily)